MHYGSLLDNETIALLFSYPQVYVDIAQNNWGPVSAFPWATQKAH